MTFRVQRQAVRTIRRLHDPAKSIGETHRLSSDRALAQDSAHESHNIIAVDKHPAEVTVLKSGVIDEELSPVLGL
jgi:hypothetical protein